MIQHRKTIITAILVLAAFLSSCAARQTPVTETLKLKGHSEIWLDHRIVQIDFKGKNDEKVDRLKNMAVLRAADLGKERGFSHFVILNTTDQTIIDGVLRSGDQILPVEKLKVSVVVKFVNKDDAEYPRAFDIDAKIDEILKNMDK